MITYSNWGTEHCCVKCGAFLTFSEKMYNLGRCPKCGYKHPDASTVVRTKERGFRIATKKTGSWWQFWKKKEEWIEYADEDICPGCGNKIDPEVCWCGAYVKEHGYSDNHAPVPMGCDCARV